KKHQADDILTIFSDKCTVKFTQTDGTTGEGWVETVRGQWCDICKHNKEFLLRKGKRKAFHMGGNSSCQQHIWIHYSIYQARCAEHGIKENHYTVPHEVKNARVEAKKIEHRGQ
ncbi:hypothetical protein SCLCIDRAFT_145794, partial [Scleroderma citrinum Foug A]